MQERDRTGAIVEHIIAAASLAHGMLSLVSETPSHSLSSLAWHALREGHITDALFRRVKRVAYAASAAMHVMEVGLQALEVDLEGCLCRRCLDDIRPGHLRPC